MSALRTRAALRRHRRRLALLAAIVVLGGAITVHHSGLPTDLGHHADMGAVVELCLGVLTAVGVVLAAVAPGVVVLARPPAPRRVPVAARAPLRLPIARARHGPAVLALLCVSRR